MISIRNKYLVTGLLIYTVSISYLCFFFETPLKDFLEVAFVFGIGLPVIAWLFLKNDPELPDKPAFKNERMVLVALVLWVFFYTTYGSALINQYLPVAFLESKRMAVSTVFFKKLFVFVLIPFSFYKMAGFAVRDFGLIDPPSALFSRKSIALFLVFSVAVNVFEYFFSNGSQPVRDGSFTASQLLIGLPLAFFYLLFDAGLIEEFFFRGIVQSRISVLMKSSTGGIVLSALIFGLIHAPGLFLRGAEGEGITEQLPLLFWMAYTVAYMSIAGIFLSYIWSKTKNLWLVMAIHAMVDLLPNLKEFIETWGI